MSRGLAPVGPEKAKVLILGSFPSRRSLGAGEYYGHPRNHFWPMLAEIAREKGLAGPGSPRDWEGKVLLLDRLGLALWDLGASAAAFFARHFAPETGLGSAAIGQILPWTLRTAGGEERQVLLTRLPSTSPIPTSRFRTMGDRLPWRSGFLGP